MWELSAEASAERTRLRGHGPRGQLGPFAAEGHINQLRSSDRHRRISWGPSTTVRRASIAPSRSTSLLVANNQRRNRLSRSLSMERLCSRSRQKQTSNFLRIRAEADIQLSTHSRIRARTDRSRHPALFAEVDIQLSSPSRIRSPKQTDRSRHPTFTEADEQKQTSNFRADARRRSRHPTFAEPSAGEPIRQPAFCAINPNQLIRAFDSRRH
jgi:hypothetical protein